MKYLLRLSILVSFGIFLIYSYYKKIHNKEQRAVGIYKVFKEDNNKSFGKNEIQFYENTLLYLYPDNTFLFSKMIREKSDRGTWKIHDDPLSGLIVLRFSNNAYGEIGFCEKLECKARFNVQSNGKSKWLMLRKISNYCKKED